MKKNLYKYYYNARIHRRLCETLFVVCLIISTIFWFQSFISLSVNSFFIHNRSSIISDLPSINESVFKYFDEQPPKPIERYTIKLNKTDKSGRPIYLHSNGNVRRRFDLKIGIFVSIISRDQFNRYKMALNSLECYAAYHRYQLEIIYEPDVPQMSAKCRIDDWMFRRHCIAAISLTKYDWMLFLDADVGVVNPTHLIEEWIDERVNVIFYDRIWNHEVMTGGYLIRNSEYSIEFLRNFAYFVNELPKDTYTGTDNGAIHYYLVKLLTPHAVEKMKFCYKIYRHSHNLDDMFIYEACCRAILGENRLWPGRVKLLGRGEGWARDYGVTSHLWSNRDFMLHAWKEENFVNHQKNTNIDIHAINGTLDIDECGVGELQDVWQLAEHLVSTDDVINKSLLEYEVGSTAGFWRRLAEIRKFFDKT